MRRFAPHLLVMATLAIVPLVAVALEADDLPKAVAEAKTASDHEAIAAYYEKEAQEARAKAADHKRMGSVYETHQAPMASKGTQSALHKTMPAHCERVASNLEATAQQLDMMAAAHREAAKAAAQ